MLFFVSILFSSLLIHTIHHDSDHALYLSSTELQVEDGEILITVKVFSDDLRDAIKNHDATSYQSGELEYFASKNSELIENYFRHHLTVKNEEVVLLLAYEEYTVEGDAHFVKFRVRSVDQVIALSVNASYFMELFPTQMNVVVAKKGDQSTYLKFTHPAAPQQVIFQH